MEFIALDLDPLGNVRTHVETKVYANRGDIELLAEELLADFSFRTPYRDFEHSVKMIADEVKALVNSGKERREIESIEVIKKVFYQMTRAYLVGRINGRDWTMPFVVSLRNGDSGVVVDAIMLEEGTVSVLFSFTRSYFHVDLAHVGEVVKFLKSILPLKRVSELFTVLGRAKQGKTERYRELFGHLQQSDDEFILAPGERGLVMICFTLQSFDVVFKLIRDKFPYQKNILREDVLNKYELVFKHDRAGRLVDAQEFKLIKFPRSRFSASLLEELQKEAARTVHFEGNDLIIDHVYIERRMTPLDLYVRTAPPRTPRRRDRVWAGHARTRRERRVSWRPAAQELRSVAARSRDLLRLRRVVPVVGMPVPSAPAVPGPRRRRGGRTVVPRRRETTSSPETFINFLGFDPQLKQRSSSTRTPRCSPPNGWRGIQERLREGELLEVLPHHRHRVRVFSSL